MLYDAEADRYLVSNVNGGPLARDDNGFISVLSPDGQVTNPKWIEGGKGGLQLHAPKGLAIAGGVLYVADISVVRTFDARSGAHKSDIDVPGATFLSDLAVGQDGNVYLADAGVPSGSFAPNGTDSVYVIEGGRAKPLAKGLDLKRPESLVWTPRGLVVASFESNEVYRLDARGRKQDVTKTPGAGLAGLVSLGDFLLVTSWETSSVLRGKLGGTFEVAVAGQSSPADLGYDSKRARLLVPHFTENTVEAFDLK